MADVSMSATVTWSGMPKVRPQGMKPLLNDLCGIIIQDIQEGIVDRRQIDGSPMPALEPGTIMEKANRGHVRAKIARETAGTARARNTGVRRGGVIAEPDHQLIDTGNLLKNQKKTVGDLEATIEVGSTRKEIAKDLQVYGVGKTAKKFNFFGISKIAETKIGALLQSKGFRYFMDRV